MIECMLFEDNIVLVEESRKGINSKIELLKEALESHFQFSRSKTDYKECKFSNMRASIGQVKIGIIAYHKSIRFRYLESNIESDGEMTRDISA